MQSAAFSPLGIVLFNNFVEKDGKIRAIEFFANSLSSININFQLNVNQTVFLFNLIII